MASSIEFSFGFDLTQLGSSTERAQALVARSMMKISSMSGAAFGAAAGAAQEAFEKMVDVAKEAAEKVEGVFEQGAAIQALSERTGIATGRLFMFQEAMKETDVDANMLAPSINRLQLKLAAAAEGSRQAEGDFRKIGVNWRDLFKMNPDKQFAAVANALAALPDPADRAGNAIALFGRSGAELLPLFNNSSAVAAMGGALSSQAQAMQDNAPKFHQASVELKQAGDAFQGFYVGLGAGVVDSFNDVLKKAGAEDFVAKGEAVGHAIGAVIHGLMSAWDSAVRVFNLGVSFGALLTGAAVDFANVIWGGIKMAGDALIHQLKLGVRAGPCDISGIINVVTGLEHRHGRADRFDGSGGIPAQNARFLFNLRLGSTNLGIHRIHGNRFDSHQQIVARRLGLGQLGIKQRLRIGDGKIAGKGDGFHARMIPGFRR